jgi:hypothetical protein
MMNLTIAFITAREEPHLDWLIETLEPQMRSDDQISLIIVDALGRTTAGLDLDAPNALASIHVVMPKPNVWQGPHRIAPRDYFANANARNTAIIHCQSAYIAFLDDRVRLGNTWLGVVREAAKRSAIVCGPYDKIEDGPVDTNNVSRAVAPGVTRRSIDSRSERAPHGLARCPGGWLFGGNFAAPLISLMVVNGCEEGCDPTGQEDCVLGLMLANTGRQIDFRADMAVLQDRTGDVHVPAFPRLDKGISPRDRSHATIDRFGKLTRTELTPELYVLRELVREQKPLPVPDPACDHRDWYDNMPIKETPCPT